METGAAPKVIPAIQEPHLFWVVCAVIAVGAALLAMIANSGVRILRETTQQLLTEAVKVRFRSATEAVSMLLERRNELWAAHAQLLVAVLVAVLLSVLLLTGVISAEAGLPILSGVSGFALAKQGGNGRRDPDNRDDQSTPPPPPEGNRKAG